MSAGALARKLHVPRTRIERLAAEQSPVTTDTALRLAKYFRTTPDFWLNLQFSFDLNMKMPALQAELGAIEEFDNAA